MPDAERHRRTVIAGGTAWLTRMVQAAISLGAAIVLARLLTPDAFGVFAMVVPLGVVANQLAGQSFQTALLQRVGLTPDEVRHFFRFAVRANLAIAVLMVLAGFVLAWFFDEPRVRAVAAAWALAIWLLTITTFQEAMLKRELRFPVVMVSQLTGLVIGVASAITAATMGLGWGPPPAGAGHGGHASRWRRPDESMGAVAWSVGDTGTRRLLDVRDSNPDPCVVVAGRVQAFDLDQRPAGVCWRLDGWEEPSR